MVKSLGEGLDELCSGRKVALLSYNNEAFMDHVDNHVKCRIIQIPDVLFAVTSAMRLQAGSPFTSVFNHKYERN